MNRLTLNADERAEKGSGALVKVRREGWVPAILYGTGLEPVPLKVRSKEVTQALARSESIHVMLDLMVSPRGKEGKEGKSPAPKKYVVMLKDYQIDAVSRALTHLDFCKVDLAKKLEVSVPVHLVGKAAGLQKGGIVDLIRREIAIECLPDKIPQHIEVDITPLDIGDSIHISQVPLPEGVSLTVGAEYTVVSVVAPREEEAAPAPAAEAAPVEGAPAAEEAPAAAGATAAQPAKEKGAAKGAAPAGEKGDKKEEAKKS